MPLLSRFDEDLKSALKASDRVKVSVLRMVKAALKNKDIERGHPLTDEEIFPVIVKVSIVGVGMRGHAGVAATMFKVLAGEGINIMMISTPRLKFPVW